MADSFPGLVFLKLGGSLITDKSRPGTPRPAVLARLSAEIAAALDQKPGLKLVLGHGSGSFGHTAASAHGTRRGVRSPEQWRGFAEVWRQAAALHHLVMEGLHEAGVPAVSFPPSAGAMAEAGRVSTWDLGAMGAALEAGLVPVVYGDVAFDAQKGGTILSTEDLFAYLAHRLRPARILLAGLEPGVWADFPARSGLIHDLNPADLPGHRAALQGAQEQDVTGGMFTKVQVMARLAMEIRPLEVFIFAGEPSGNVARALAGEYLGTRIQSPGEP